ncbi:L-amino acid N-acyltransferase YncA [Arcticibacter tournemirensis]|uniref:GNAT family N-acetyltransferase n=1 Tax=Arcticibacter tournemirensis TaxID=699437 RepID=A0A5M9HIT3_9SPHI|nr:GNAT family N-acetyltransferase [Arcticibacter tournemirensis]KAA8485334.1 GNAT family N-acetyltransferase [Arcticibacter tournemirensis]TQM50381.1 L-amino acid N-acyltransferase YncA [Arcticibacter tournemirensis]
MTIRAAERADCPRIMELVHQLAVFEKAPHEVTVSRAEFEEAGFGTNPVWKAFVAEVNGKIEGFALYYVRFSTWKGCRMYLEDLYITEDFRGLGIGKRLLETLMQEAREKGFNGITWQVLEWNEPAIKFYKRYNARFDNEWVNVSVELNEHSKTSLQEII